MTETSPLAAIALTKWATAVLADGDGVREAIDSMEPLQLARLKTAAQIIEDEVERAEAVVAELDRVTVFDTRPMVASFDLDEANSKRLGEFIEQAVFDNAVRQAAAVEQMRGIAARRGCGVGVLTDGRGVWQVQPDPEMPPGRVSHRAVDVLPPLAGEEESTDAH